MRSVFATLNDEQRDPDTRTEMQARRDVLPIPGLQWSPKERDEAAANEAAGIEMTRHLLATWDSALVRELLDDVLVKGAAYRLMNDEAVQLEPRVVTGPARALNALVLAQARALVRSVGGGKNAFRRRAKQCTNPTCEKWFFDTERGTRKWCCVACGNAHRQLRLSETYEERKKAGYFAARRCPCSREGCEG